MKRRILYDTDLIGDDLLTLVIGMGLKDLQFEGITSFGRRVSSYKRAELAEYLVNLLCPYPVRIAAGANSPLVRPSRNGCDACDKPIMDFSSLYRIENKQKSTIENSATRLITSIIKNNPEEITLLCTGPLTNVALAFKESPEIASMVRDLVIMGGTAWVPGNVSPVAESNIYNDPEAAKIVFDHFPNITMVGLDVTLKVLVDDEVFNSLSIEDTIIGRLIKGIIDSCIKEHKRRGRGINAMPLHDPLALMVALKPDLIKTINCDVNIETCGTYTTGQTVCSPVFPSMSDFKNENTTLVKVATEVDQDSVIKMFKDALLNVNCKKNP